jgi:trehalose/maltose hydrolase-like predicted phosphorylase
MAAVLGLCGISYAESTLTIAPRLPAHWNQVTFPLVFHGQKLRLRLSAESVCIQIVGALERPLFISVEGISHPLPQAGELSIPFTPKRSG